MKISLYTNSLHSQRDGFLLIEWPSTDLDNIVEDGEAEEILALSILDKIPFNKLDEVLTKIVKKLRHGGKITVDYLDIIDVSKGIVSRALSLEQANNILYLSGNKSCLTTMFVSDLLQTKGLRLLTKRIASYLGTIVAQRP